MKLVILFVSVLPGVAMAEPVTPGKKPMVARKAADVYSVIGEGEVRTVGCTFSAPMLRARIEGGSRPWIWFYGDDGELEGGCAITTRPAVVVRPIQHPPIRRSIAVATR